MYSSLWVSLSLVHEIHNGPLPKIIYFPQKSSLGNITVEVRHKRERAHRVIDKQDGWWLHTRKTEICNKKDVQWIQNEIYKTGNCVDTWDKVIHIVGLEAEPLSPYIKMGKTRIYEESSLGNAGLIQRVRPWTNLNKPKSWEKHTRQDDRKNTEWTLLPRNFLLLLLRGSRLSKCLLNVP